VTLVASGDKREEDAPRTSSKQKSPVVINRDASGKCGLLVKLTKLVADINLRRENLVYSKRAVELKLEVAYSQAQALALRNETGVVSGADMTEQGFRHLGGPPR
jgi:hypothetical protein